MDGKASIDMIPELPETKGLAMSTLNWEESLANQMVRERYAVRSAENYNSSTDHEDRAETKNSKSADFKENVKKRE